MNDKWDETKYVESDPRNVMVEPKLIIDSFKKLDKDKPVACATKQEINMNEEVKTAEEIAQDYTAMGHSVDLINGIIDGSKNDQMISARQKNNDCVDRNVEHLEIMVAKDYWTDESMTASNSAITAGKAYIAS